MEMKHIVLIGFMGCGKSTVSKLLAEKLDWPLVDTDARIEQEQGKTISQIFAERGEPWFRILESELIERLSKEETPMIISTGGGLPVQPQNKELLEELGQVIYMKTQPQTVLKRLEGDTTRPLLQGDDKEQKVVELLSKRNPIYESVADYIIQTDELSPEEIVEVIINKTRNL